MFLFIPQLVFLINNPQIFNNLGRNLDAAVIAQPRENKALS